MRLLILCMQLLDSLYVEFSCNPSKQATNQKVPENLTFLWQCCMEVPSEQMLNWKEENFFLSCYCFVFLLSSALCEEQRSVGVMWFIWASVVCMYTRAEERWMETWNVWVKRGGWMSLRSNKQGGLSGGCVVTVCAVTKMFSKLCNYISNYYYYHHLHHCHRHHQICVWWILNLSLCPTCLH